MMQFCSFGTCVIVGHVIHVEYEVNLVISCAATHCRQALS